MMTLDEHKQLADTLFDLDTRVAGLRSAIIKAPIPRRISAYNRLTSVTYKLFKVRDNLDLLFHKTLTPVYDGKVYRVGSIGPKVEKTWTVPEILVCLGRLTAEVSELLSRLQLPVHSEPMKALRRAHALLQRAVSTLREGITA